MTTYALNQSTFSGLGFDRLFEAATPQRALPKQALARASMGDETSVASGWKNVARHRMGLALQSSKCSKSLYVDPALGFKAMRFLEFALASQRAPEAPFFVPRPDGGLQLEWHTESVEIEVYFDPEGDVSAWATDRNSGYEIEVADDETLPFLILWAPRVSHKELGMGEERVSENGS